jgi:signal transduction histidine kinase/ActR/RegA family two-component response regulator
MELSRATADGDHQFWRQNNIPKAFMLHGQNVRTVVNAVLAVISAPWVGAWALLWFAAVTIDTYTFAWSAAKVRALWGRGEPRREELVGALLRSAGAVLHSSLWIAVWVIAGADAGFLAGVMMTIAVIPVLVYWPNSQLMFIAYVAPPVLVGVGAVAYLHPAEVGNWLILPVILAAALRVYWLRHDQKSLYENVARNQAMRISAEEANIAKSQFLATMSHELRTPLNAITGYAEILEEDLEADGKKQSAEDAARIRRAARDLLGLINEVLDLSKIEAGRMDVAIERTDVTDLVDDVVSTTAHIAEANGNVVKVALDPLAGELMIDGPKFRQCLLNLVSNACKFTNGGTIDLRVGTTIVEGGLTLQATVSDTGIGISTEQAARLFQPFVQADSSLTRAKGGTGLGLVITRRLAQLMGGDVTMQSAAGQGSVFVLTISAARPDENDVVERRRADAPLVLVVEDEPAARDLIRRALARLPLNVLCAASAAEGSRLAARQPPALIVLDLHLPDRSGWDLLAEFKNDRALAETPVMIVSIDDDRQRAISQGACDHLVKPVDRDRLAAAVMRYIRLVGQAEPNDAVFQSQRAAGVAGVHQYQSR